ncbi:hypothetical protein IGI73_003349 [Enterococcus sp. DIV0755f]
MDMTEFSISEISKFQFKFVDLYLKLEVLRWTNGESLLSAGSWLQLTNRLDTITYWVRTLLSNGLTRKRYTFYGYVSLISIHLKALK